MYIQGRICNGLGTRRTISGKIGSGTSYGYRKLSKDALGYDDILEGNRIPIFMFRFQGLNDLKDELENYYVVFIDGDSQKAVKYSLDKSQSDIVTETETIRKELVNTIEEFKKEGRQHCVIKNHYDKTFFCQIDALNLPILLKEDNK